MVGYPNAVVPGREGPGKVNKVKSPGSEDVLKDVGGAGVAAVAAAETMSKSSERRAAEARHSDGRSHA
jgi:hypothetical protein